MQQKRCKRIKGFDVEMPLQQSKYTSRLQQQGSSRKRSLIKDQASWALKKLQVKQPGIDEEEDKLSRHHPVVATSSAQERRSRHHTAVATVVVKSRCRDIIQRSRHQCTEKEVATTFGCRDINCQDRRSRQHLDVTTSIT